MVGKVMIDKTISWGHILTAAAMIATGIGYYSTQVAIIRLIDQRLTEVERTTADLTTQYGPLQTRVTVLETNMSQLRATMDQTYAEVREGTQALTTIQIDLARLVGQLTPRNPLTPDPF